MDKPPVAILGVPFDNVTMAEALDAIQQMVLSRQSHYVVTANVDFLVQARTDVELRRILFDAHLVLCDGTPVLWASRLLGRALPERVAGADLVPKLVALAAREHYRVFLLGATPTAVEQAAQRLQAQYPGVIIAGYYSPPFRTLLKMDHQEIMRRIVQAQPDLLFVAFGCPKQEKWLAMHYRELGVPVSVGVGATIDFLAGQVRRAPAWMQRAGIEWVFRLAQEPRRLFRRYLRDLWAFAWALLTQWCLLRLLARKSAAHLSFHPRELPNFEAEPPWPAPGALAEDGSLQRARLSQPFSRHRLGDARHFVLDLAVIASLDSTGLAALMRLERQLHAEGADLCLLRATHAVRRALRLMRVADFFLMADDLNTARALFAQRERARRAQVLGQNGGPAGRLLWRGEITAANAEAVWQQTQHALAAPLGGQDWHIDLSEVRFIDSAGVGVMIRTKRLAEQQQQPLTFTNLQPAVRNVLHLAGLESALADTVKRPRSPGQPHNQPALNSELAPQLRAAPIPAVDPGPSRLTDR